MVIRDKILRQKTDFKAICQKHHVKSLYAFGSSTSEKFNPEKSDIDLLVEIDDPDPLERGEKLMSLWDNLESFFQRRVDLLTESSIRNPYLRKNVDATKILIYDGKGAEVLV